MEALGVPMKEVFGYEVTATRTRDGRGKTYHKFINYYKKCYDEQAGVDYEEGAMRSANSGTMMLKTTQLLKEVLEASPAKLARVARLKH